MHNESNAVRCSHEDCKDNPRVYNPEQARLHMYIHERKTLKCNDPGYEDSDLLYNKISLRRHRDEQHIKLFCPFRDCGAPLSSWSSMHYHVFSQHNIQTTSAKVKAAAPTAFSVSLPGPVTTVIVVDTPSSMRRKGSNIIRKRIMAKRRHYPAATMNLKKLTSRKERCSGLPLSLYIYISLVNEQTSRGGDIATLSITR